MDGHEKPCDIDMYSLISLVNAESSFSSNVAGASYSRILPAEEKT